MGALGGDAIRVMWHLGSGGRWVRQRSLPQRWQVVAVLCRPPRQLGRGVCPSRAEDKLAERLLSWHRIEPVSRI